MGGRGGGPGQTRSRRAASEAFLRLRRELAVDEGRGDLPAVGIPGMNPLGDGDADAVGAGRLAEDDDDLLGRHAGLDAIVVVLLDPHATAEEKDAGECQQAFHGSASNLEIEGSARNHRYTRDSVVN